MMFNNQYLLDSLYVNEGSLSARGKPRRRLASKYVLLERLPSTSKVALVAKWLNAD
jgi:hypothetical protein